MVVVVVVVVIAIVVIIDVAEREEQKRKTVKSNNLQERYKEDAELTPSYLARNNIVKEWNRVECDKSQHRSSNKQSYLSFFQLVQLWNGKLRQLDDSVGFCYLGGPTY